MTCCSLVHAFLPARGFNSPQALQEHFNRDGEINVREGGAEMTTSDSRIASPTRSGLLIAWLWPSLLLGLLSLAAVIATGIDYSHSWQVPFALAEYVVFGLPVGFLYGLFVFGVVVLVRHFAYSHFTFRTQGSLYGAVGFIVSAGGLYGLLTLFRVSLPLLCAHSEQGSRSGSPLSFNSGARGPGPDEGFSIRPYWSPKSLEAAGMSRGR